MHIVYLWSEKELCTRSYVLHQMSSFISNICPHMTLLILIVKGPDGFGADPGGFDVVRLELVLIRVE